MKYIPASTFAGKKATIFENNFFQTAKKALRILHEIMFSTEGISTENF